MPTFTALTTLDDRERAHALADALERLDPAPTGVGVFEIEDGSGVFEVGGYFLDRPDDIALALLSAAHGAMSFTISQVEDRDWVAQVRRELHPVHAGRFTVYGAHDAHSVGPQRIGLRIEAAMAFGTGHHATTWSCLALYDDLLRRGLRPVRVADIGCGTGVLAMAAARATGVRVIASDVDPVAVATSRANAAANAIGVRMLCVPAVGLRHPLFRQSRFDLIFANILARPLKRMAPDLARHLAPGGHAILSGILSTQTASVEAVARGHGLCVVRRLRRDGWTSSLLRKVQPV